MRKQRICRTMSPGERAQLLSVILLSVLLPCCILFLSLPAHGQGHSQKVVLGLKDCIRKAVEVSPEIRESRYEQEVYKSKKKQADSAQYPQIELIAVTGPSPEAKEDEFLKTDIKDKSINGVFGRVDFTLTQPLYTFGKIDAYREAAERGIKVAKAGVDKKTSDIVLRTKELYYSLLLAKDLLNLALEIRDDLLDSIRKAEDQIRKGSPWADEMNLVKLRTFLGEVNRNINEIEKGIALARSALMASIDIPEGTDFDIPEATLRPEELLLDDLNHYVKSGRDMRPEFVQLREGLIAREALVQVEKSNFYPQFFLGVKGFAAAATNRDRIQNPYVYDVFSDVVGAAYIGLKWSLDFGITDGRVKEAEAEYNKIAEKKKYADGAIPLQIRKAYLDYQEAKKNISETENAYTNARKWLISAIANFDLGVGEAKEIADAAVMYAQTKTNHLRSLFNTRISYAQLLSFSGTDITGMQ